MKKFDRNIHNTMGSLPPALVRHVGHANVEEQTAAFNDAITKIAQDFEAQLADGMSPGEIKLHSPEIFGRPVTLDYIASGSVGSVYKIQIGDDVFALKINRNASAGELSVMHMQSRARNLVNKMYMGSMFKHNGRKYSWVLSDYVARDSENSFARAMEKMYYAYLTKGIYISDAHANNFIDGKLIDQASFSTRNGKIDDIRRLSRTEIDTVKKLVYYIKTNNVARFTDLINRAAKTNPAVIRYMFFAMKFGRSPGLTDYKTSEFAIRLKKFEDIVNIAHRANDNKNIADVKSARTRGFDA